MSLSADQFAQHLQSDIITVIVGENLGIAATFNVHRDLLTHRSKWFRDQLTDEWKESLEGVSRLPEHSGAAFAVLVSWLYRDTLPHDIKAETSLPLTGFPLKDWIDTWILFDYLLMPAQQDLVMNRMCDVVNNYRDRSFVNEHDAVQMVDHGKQQLRNFACAAVAMSLVTGAQRWTDFEQIHANVEFVAEVWDSIRADIGWELLIGRNAILCWVANGTDSRLNVSATADRASTAPLPPLAGMSGYSWGNTHI